MFSYPKLLKLLASKSPPCGLRLEDKNSKWQGNRVIPATLFKGVLCEELGMRTVSAVAVDPYPAQQSGPEEWEYVGNESQHGARHVI